MDSNKKKAGRPSIGKDQKKVKPNITLDPALIQLARQAAEAARQTFSAWVATAIENEIHRTRAHAAGTIPFPASMAATSAAASPAATTTVPASTHPATAVPAPAITTPLHATPAASAATSPAAATTPAARATAKNRPTPAAASKPATTGTPATSQPDTDPAERILAFPEIPLLHAAAGEPFSADRDTYIPTRQLGPGRFAVQLHGGSMSPRYPDGSIVILRERETLKNPVLKKGEIYLFDIEGEKTLKLYGSRPATKAEIATGHTYTSPADGKTKVRILKSLNPSHPEIPVTEDVSWLGWLDKADNR